MVLAYDPVDTTANGTEMHPCAGCGVEIPSHKRWCSESCRSKHRDRDRSARDVVADVDHVVNTETAAAVETWTFGQVVAELVGHGLVVDLEIEGIPLRLSRQP